MAINDDLKENYILHHIDSEGEQLSKLYRDAHTQLVCPHMMSGHLQGRFLKMLVQISKPKKILEIGTYTGYATICMAEALSVDAEIHTIEKNDEIEEFILKQFQTSILKDKIHLHLGDALEIIPQLSDQFEMVYIDADKCLYSKYYDLVFDKTLNGGIIVADNTLWNGKVWEKVSSKDKKTIGILEFNKKIKQDKRVEKVIIPLRDGLTIIYKK